MITRIRQTSYLQVICPHHNESDICVMY